ncbi:LysR family transcriptional regulator [Halieaceae bacterium IMCC8485]|jgi:DNA-binding transcriptional LysR family regulator|uniref:LysR family transcriptional regulator n=1 Tax=Candidatus Seongchinamella marina TaxID=2518990 RepID=A0ABT3SXA0_9GAMM|nr:LysR family transcriptional regulator [Candidatus Seongchinamella marina]MCX2973937.1 LysR family transcriptional regulator [Candidatus Seongchinamella marina]
MISRKLIRTDLNLLVALQILLEERNVTRAAERLSVSQPALSKTLHKLRDSFEDELFTRTAHGLVPTPRAEELGAQLPTLLESVERVLGESDFDPLTYLGSFKLLLPPILCEALLPGLVAELDKTAPGVQVITAEITPDYQELLKKGEIDFAAFVAMDTERDIHAEPIATLAPRCYMRIGHPLGVKKEIELQEFLAHNHLRLYLPGLTRENTSMVDDVLGQYGAHRKIALETTQFASAVGVLARTDSLLVANAGFEASGLYSELITGRELPAELQRMIRNTLSSNRGKMSLLRHTRTSRSAPHQWMRTLLMKHLSGPGESAEPIRQPKAIS